MTFSTWESLSGCDPVTTAQRLQREDILRLLYAHRESTATTLCATIAARMTIGITSAWLRSHLANQTMNVFEEHAIIFDALSRVMAQNTDPAEEARLTELARDVDRRMKAAKRAEVRP